MVLDHTMHTHAHTHMPRTHTHTHTNIAPNSGLTLWVQQFCAMFLKRFYNSLRFWTALISQLFLPLVFVLLALVLAVTLPDPSDNDPSRDLILQDSALSNRIYLFHADFTDNTSGPIDSAVSLKIVLCVCVYVCVLAYVFVHVSLFGVCMFVCLCTHTCLYVCVCMYVCMCVYVL